jgi:hypothetical protein
MAIKNTSAPRPATVRYEDTLQYAVAQVVQKAAQRLSGRLYGSRERDPATGRLLWFGIDKEATQARVRDQVWRGFDAGKALRELSHSRYAGWEKTKALRAIEGNDELRKYHQVALDALRDGIDIG